MIVIKHLTGPRRGWYVAVVGMVMVDRYTQNDRRRNENAKWYSDLQGHRIGWSFANGLYANGQRICRVWGVDPAAMRIGYNVPHS